MTPPHEHWMQHALDLAAHAATEGEVPVGAVVVSAEGELLGSGFNQPILSHDPTAHAEVMALRDAAARMANYRLPGCTLYVTIEPCTMCVGAMVHARIAKVVFGAPEPRFGAVISGRRLLDEGEFNHRMTWEGGVLAQRSSEVMKTFFQQRRVGEILKN